MRKFLKFVHDDNVYCKYYEVFYILFHTGLRISEFCGLTIKDIDLKNRIINIDHQLQRIGSMEYHIESHETKCRYKKASNDGGRVPNVPGNFGRQANGFSGDYGGWLCGIPSEIRMECRI